MPLISQRTWNYLHTLRTEGLTELQANWSPCTFVAWKKDRPASGSDTWDNGKAGEAWVQGVSGTGMLRKNGDGGSVIGEEVIYQQAPFQFRTAVSYGLTANLWLVVDGTRLFKVESAPVEDPEKPIVTAFLSEVFNATLPVVTP